MKKLFFFILTFSFFSNNYALATDSKTESVLKVISSQTCNHSISPTSPQEAVSAIQSNKAGVNLPNKTPLETLIKSLGVNKKFNFSAYLELVESAKDLISKGENKNLVLSTLRESKNPLSSLAFIEAYTQSQRTDFHFLSARGLQNLHDYKPKAFKRLMEILEKINFKDKLSPLDIDVLATQLFLFQIEESSPINSIVDTLFDKIDHLKENLYKTNKNIASVIEQSDDLNNNNINDSLEIITLIKHRIAFEIGKVGVKQALDNLNIYFESSNSTNNENKKNPFKHMFSRVFSFLPNLVNKLASPIVYHWKKNLGFDALILPITYAGSLFKIQKLAEILFNEGNDSLSDEELKKIHEQVMAIKYRSQLELRINTPFAQVSKNLIKTSLNVLTPIALTVAISSMAFLATTEGARIITDAHQKECIENADVVNYNCTYALNPLLSYRLPYITSQLADMVQVGQYPDLLGTIYIDDNYASLADLYQKKIEQKISLKCDNEDCIMTEYKKIIEEAHSDFIRYLLVVDKPNISRLTNLVIELTPFNLYQNGIITSPNLNELSFEESVLLTEQTIKDIQLISELPYLRRLDVLKELENQTKLESR